MQLLLFSTALAASAPFAPPLPKACARLEWGWRQVGTFCNLPLTPSATPQLNGPNYVVPKPATTPTIAANAAPAAVFGNTPNLRGPIGGGFGLCSAFGPSTPVMGSGVFQPWRNRCRRALDAYGGLVAVCATASPNTAGTPQAPNVVGVDSAAPGDHASRARALADWAATCQAPNFVNLTPQQKDANVCPGLAGWWYVVTQACGFPASWDVTSGLRTAAYTPVTSAGTWNALFATAAGPHSILSSPAPLTHGAVTLAPIIAQVCVPVAVPTGISGGTFNAAPSGTPGTPSARRFYNSRCRRSADQFGRAARQCSLKGYNDWFIQVATALSGAIAPTTCAPSNPAA